MERDVGRNAGRSAPVGNRARPGDERAGVLNRLLAVEIEALAAECATTGFEPAGLESLVRINAKVNEAIASGDLDAAQRLLGSTGDLLRGAYESIETRLAVAERNRELATEIACSFEERGFWLDADPHVDHNGNASVVARHADHSEVVTAIEDIGDNTSRVTFDTDGVPHTHDVSGRPDHACDAIRPVLEGVLDDLAEAGCESDGLHWPGQPQHRPDERAAALRPSDKPDSRRRAHGHH